MNVKDLKNILGPLPDDMEVRMMTQPDYPLESEVDGAKKKSEFDPNIEPDSDDDYLVITEGDDTGYGSKDAWD